MKAVQEVLGEHQDSVVTRHELLDLAAAAHRDGEDTFTYGRLHGLEQARAAVTLQQFEGVSRHGPPRPALTGSDRQGLRAASSRADEGGLRGHDPRPRVVRADQATRSNSGTPGAARPRRPLHLEGVAHGRGGVEVALRRPGAHVLAARLLHLAEVDEVLGRHRDGPPPPRTRAGRRRRHPPRRCSRPSGSTRRRRRGAATSGRPCDRAAPRARRRRRGSGTAAHRRSAAAGPGGGAHRSKSSSIGTSRSCSARSASFAEARAGLEVAPGQRPADRRLGVVGRVVRVAPCQRVLLLLLGVGLGHLVALPEVPGAAGGVHRRPFPSSPRVRRGVTAASRPPSLGSTAAGRPTGPAGTGQPS